jgi:hypothetical protein
MYKSSSVYYGIGGGLHQLELGDEAKEPRFRDTGIRRRNRVLHLALPRLRRSR